MTTTYETELVGDDYTGLPTTPVTYRNKPSRTGIDWDQVRDNYVANGGHVDDTVWAKGNIVIIGGSANSSRANIHTFQEAEEYDEPTPAIPNRAPRPKLERSKINSEQRRVVARRYEGGATVLELARDYSVAPKTIYGALRMAGVELEERPPKIEHKRNRTDQKISAEQRVIIARRYQDGASMPELALDYGVSTPLISKILNAAGIEKRSRHDYQTPGKLSGKRDEIGQRYLAGESLSEIAKAYNVTPGAIHKTIKNLGIQTRRQGRTS